MNILLAAFCVILFSLTVPFTRLAALEISPEAIIFLRLIGGALVSLVYVIKIGKLPPRSAWKGIVFTSAGCVVGFASLVAYAMKEVPSGHGAVALAALPMATAAYSVIRDHVKPGFRFWLYAYLGTGLSFGFFFIMNVNEVLQGDQLLILAVFVAAFGYVEGGRTARLIGGAQTMSWAVIVTLPVIVPLAVTYFIKTDFSFSSMSFNAWFSVSYLALCSQSLGMFLWFSVLAKGPMEKIALVQLLQPFFTLLGSILLLNETVRAEVWVIAALVGLCIFGANQERKAAVSAEKSGPRDPAVPVVRADHQRDC